MQVLKGQGQEVVAPDQRSGLHPLAIPLTRCTPNSPARAAYYTPAEEIQHDDDACLCYIAGVL